MSNWKRRAWCVACERTGDRSDYVNMPKKESKRVTWVRSLSDGDTQEVERISMRIETVSDPVICKVHFHRSDFNNGRIRGGSLPRIMTVNSIESSVSSVSDILVGSSSTSESVSETNIISEDDPSVTFSSRTSSSASSIFNDDTSTTTKNINDFDMFLVDKNALLNLLAVCYHCGGKCTMISYVDGAVVRVNRTCESCGTSLDPWASSPVLLTRAGGSREKLHQLNLDVATASLVSGNSFKDVTAFMHTLNVPMPTTRTFDKHVKSYCNEAVERKYTEQREGVLDFATQSLSNGTRLNVSGDGQYDSAGFSANYCKYAIQENSHGFVVSQTVQHKKRGGSSAALEHKGHSESLKELQEELKDISGVDDPITSFTSDRCVKVAEEMRRNFPGISHYFDSWHFFRNVMRELLKKRNQVQFAPIKPWIRHINNQLYWAVESSRGDGQLVQEKIMSCLEHICGNHSHFEESEHYTFQKFFQCDHEPLDDDREAPAYVDITTVEGRNAIRALKTVITKAGRLEAAAKVSCFFSTSNVESYNAISMRYHPKRLSLSINGFTIRAMLATIDWNSKKWEELHGRRVVVGRKQYYNKTKREMVWRNVKTAPDMSWRREILEIARRVRSEMERPPVFGNFDGDDDLEMIDEWELDFDDGPEALRDNDGDEMLMRLTDEIENEEVEEEDTASEEL